MGIAGDNLTPQRLNRPPSAGAGVAPSGVTGGVPYSPSGALGTGDNADLYTPTAELSTNGLEIGTLTQDVSLSGANIWYGVTSGGGKLFAVNYDTASIGNNLYRWDTPTDLSTFTTVSLGVSHKFINSVCYDSLNSCVYVGYTPGSTTFTIFKVAMSDNTVTTVANATSISGGTHSTGFRHAMTTDGTYIYVCYFNNGASSYGYKFAIADGSKAAQQAFDVIPPDNTFPSASGWGVCIPDASHVAYAGAYGWTAVVPTDHSTNTLVASNAVGGTNQAPGCLAIGGNVWVCDSTDGKLYKWDVGLTTLVTYETGLASVSNISYDGTYIWLINYSGTVTKFDPTAGVVIGTWTTLNSLALPSTTSYWFSVLGTGDGYAAFSFDTVGTSASKAVHVVLS